MTDTIIFNPASPLSPADMDLGSFEPVFEAKRNQRKAAITSIIENRVSKGEAADYMFAAILYDSERAPKTTNRKQLAEGNITLPPHNTLSPEETTHYLWVAINGLAIHNTFFCGTDHLTDEAFYKLLSVRILDEEIRDVPPTADMSEFIDLSVMGKVDPVVNRDSLLPRPNRSTPPVPPVDLDADTF